MTINDTDKKKTRKLNPLIKIGLALIAISGIIFAYEALMFQSFIEVRAKVTDTSSNSFTLPPVKIQPQKETSANFADIEYSIDNVKYQCRINVPEPVTDSVMTVYCDRSCPTRCWLIPHKYDFWYKAALIAGVILIILPLLFPNPDKEKSRFFVYG